MLNFPKIEYDAFVVINNSKNKIIVIIKKKMNNKIKDNKKLHI